MMNLKVIVLLFLNFMVFSIKSYHKYTQEQVNECQQFTGVQIDTSKLVNMTYDEIDHFVVGTLHLPAETGGPLLRCLLSKLPEDEQEKRFPTKKSRR